MIRLWRRASGRRSPRLCPHVPGLGDTHRARSTLLASFPLTLYPTEISAKLNASLLALKCSAGAKNTPRGYFLSLISSRFQNKQTNDIPLPFSCLPGE